MKSLLASRARFASRGRSTSFARKSVKPPTKRVCILSYCPRISLTPLLAGKHPGNNLTREFPLKQTTRLRQQLKWPARPDRRSERTFVEIVELTTNRNALLQR